MIDPKILINQKTFDAKVFLKEVHNSTSYVDLQKGAQTLSSAVEKRAETMRSLVKNNFDRFVNAKGTTDGIHDSNILFIWVFFFEIYSLRLEYERGSFLTFF